MLISISVILSFLLLLLMTICCSQSKKRQAAALEKQPWTPEDLNKTNDHVHTKAEVFHTIENDGGVTIENVGCPAPKPQDFRLNPILIEDKRSTLKKEVEREAW